jgi:hypothetical protein
MRPAVVVFNHPAKSLSELVELTGIEPVAS